MVADALVVTGSGPSSTFGFVDTRTLGAHVSPPSSDAEKRTYHTLSSVSRPSFHIIPTTPAPFTATMGRRTFGPLPVSSRARSSLTTLAGVQVFPPSSERESTA